jgi:hypothetical protein
MVLWACVNLVTYFCKIFYFLHNSFYIYSTLMSIFLNAVYIFVSQFFLFFHLISLVTTT